MQRLSQQQIDEHLQYSEQVRVHYELEAKRMHDQMMVTFQEQHNRIVSLQKFEALLHEEEEVKHSMVMALRKAESLEIEAQNLITSAEAESLQIRSQADYTKNQAAEAASFISKKLMNRPAKSLEKLMMHLRKKALRENCQVD